MIRALLLDLGDTLVCKDRVFPGVPAALETLSQLRIADGSRLRLALVSNYDMPAAGNDLGEVTRLFNNYVELLRGFGLLQYFEPPDEHVTLSTLAGVSKPDRRIFELALKRLHLGTELAAALFITEDGGHIAAAKALGMSTLQYAVDFDYWSAAPLLVAHALGLKDPSSLLGPLNTRLQHLYGIRLRRVESCTGSAIHAILDRPDAALVALKLDELGDVERVEARGDSSGPTQSFHKMLRDTGQLAASDERLAPGQTHQEELGHDGRPRPVRKRVSLK